MPLAVILPLILATQTPLEPAQPYSTYVTRQIEGFTVHIHRDLLDEQKSLGEQVLKLLSNRLYETARVLPPHALKRLQRIPIWFELNNNDHPGGVYHPSADWLAKHNQNIDKARAVEFGNATNFLAWSHHQPSMVIHELAHAYHHQVIGHDNEQIKAAYQRAVESKTYESVLRYNGRTERAYAMRNAKEYFAEATEAYFGVNDFYPFVRAELKQHDPQMYDLLERLWSDPDLPQRR